MINYQTVIKNGGIAVSYSTLKDGKFVFRAFKVKIEQTELGPAWVKPKELGIYAENKEQVLAWAKTLASCKELYFLGYIYSLLSPQLLDIKYTFILDKNIVIKHSELDYWDNTYLDGIANFTIEYRYEQYLSTKQFYDLNGIKYDLEVRWINDTVSS